MIQDELQSEAPSVDRQIDELLLRLYLGDSKEMASQRHQVEINPALSKAKAKINRLITEAELRGFDKAFDSHDYDGLREYRKTLSNNLSKGDV